MSIHVIARSEATKQSSFLVATKENWIAAHQVATIDLRDPKSVNHVPEQV